MSAVIDASVLVAAMVDTGPNGIWAETVLSGGLLYGPELLAAETTNILRRLERAKRITSLEANTAHEDHKRLEIELYPLHPSLTASGCCGIR